jgi:periplasmic divalent cation tolerance protein
MGSVDDRADCVVAMVTVGSLEEGHSLARAVVEAHLAACVNIIPHVVSVYRWEGKVEESSEAKLFIKTTAARAPALIAEVRRLHSYDVCEVTVIPVVDGNEPYLEWVRQSVVP